MPPPWRLTVAFLTILLTLPIANAYPTEGVEDCYTVIFNAFYAKLPAGAQSVPLVYVAGVDKPLLHEAVFLWEEDDVGAKENHVFFASYDAVDEGWRGEDHIIGCLINP